MVSAIAVDFAPAADGQFIKPVFAGLETSASGVNATRDDSVMFTGLDADLSEALPTTF